MRSNNILILDANIIIRAVLGNKVRNLLIQFNEVAQFFTPDICMADAQKYLPIIFEKRKLPVDSALNVLDKIKKIVQIIDKNIYQDYFIEAQQRIKSRDFLDWPVVAAALALNCPVWTEDQDFFGSGLSVWTTDRIHLFFE